MRLRWTIVPLLLLAACGRTPEDPETARRELAKAEAKVARELGDAREEAGEHVAEAWRGAHEELAEKRRELAAAESAASKERQEKHETAPASDELAGVVTSREGDDLRLRQSDGSEVGLLLRAKVPVVRGGEAVTRDQLREGTQVRASYHVEGDRNVVDRLDVTTPLVP